MIDFDQHRQRLQLSSDELRTLVQLATGHGDAAAAPQQWVAAGVVADGAVHPIAAAMAAVAVAPHRAIAIERLVGDSIAPLMVGWHRSGRATLTEHRPTDDGDGTLAITATHFEMLPALLLQAIGLHPDLPAATRSPIATTAGVVDDAIVDLARGGVLGSLAASDDLMAVLECGDVVLRATGSWQGEPADTTVTLLLAGAEGVWLVERDPATGDRDPAVRLVPSDVATAAARLGDVVTGRRAPRHAAA